MSDSKIYILVHAWLAPVQKGIQAAHSIQGWEKATKDLSIVLLETRKSKPQSDLVEAIGIANRLDLKDKMNIFIEEQSCNGGQITAVAFVLNDTPGIAIYGPEIEMIDYLNLRFRLAS